MDGAPRIPPRFVPTLTTVVDLEAPAPAPAPSALPDLSSPALGDGAQQASAASDAPAAIGAQVALPAVGEADAFRLEEELLHRVLQRVDLSLEERLTEAVSTAVQEQLDAMLPRLRGEVEKVLRELVTEAMARELSENPGSATGSGASGLA